MKNKRGKRDEFCWLNELYIKKGEMPFLYPSFAQGIEANTAASCTYLNTGWLQETKVRCQNSCEGCICGAVNASNQICLGKREQHWANESKVAVYIN